MLGCERNGDLCGKQGLLYLCLDVGLKEEWFLVGTHPPSVKLIIAGVWCFKTQARQGLVTHANSQQESILLVCRCPTECIAFYLMNILHGWFDGSHSCVMDVTLIFILRKDATDIVF